MEPLVPTHPSVHVQLGGSLCRMCGCAVVHDVRITCDGRTGRLGFVWRSYEGLGFERLSITDKNTSKSGPIAKPS